LKKFSKSTDEVLSYHLELGLFPEKSQCKDRGTGPHLDTISILLGGTPCSFMWVISLQNGLEKLSHIKKPVGKNGMRPEKKWSGCPFNK
jgi:hypothetical protein